VPCGRSGAANVGLVVGKKNGKMILTGHTIICGQGLVEVPGEHVLSFDIETRLQLA
jgi:hypothetical protein